MVAGEPAKVSELRQQWSDTTVAENPREFARFVIRRASLAIERVELRLLGPEYKSPRLIKPEMLASARFREGLEKIPGATVEKAGEMLDELSTGWSRFSVDLIPSLGRAIFSRGFDPNIDYDRAEIESMRRALENHPAVLLFSHRSYLDGVIVPVAMQENRLPPVHTFAGINLSFGFMGPLMRHSGVIFIRRKLDDPLYKYVLRQFVGYIVEKRFNLSWSIEGTRSRTGKMLPPKLGLLAYVADAYLDGRSDDILLQPVSISFDQLHETAEYAAYARGGEKTPEGLSWLYNFIKAQGERNYGKIYVRFPEAVSMREYLGEPHGPMATDEAAKRLAMQKMAFEVAWRILRATPVNATALVSALLLTTRGVALTLDQLHHTLQDSLDYLERKQTPMTNSALRLRTADGVRAALDALSNGHPVTRVDGGREPVWRIAPEARARGGVLPQHDHRRVPGDRRSSSWRWRTPRAPNGDRLEAFWTQAMRLRDLLKFDFYFADSAAFREHIAEEMAWHEDWEAHVAAGGDEIDTLLRAKRPLIAQRHAAAVLRGLRDRGRRAARRARRDRREGTDQEGAGRRPPVRRAEPGAQQRVGVGAAVRDRAAGGRRPASAGTRGRSRRAARPRSATNFAASCATWTRSSRSRASSSTRARCSDARCAASRPRTACGPAAATPYAGHMTTGRAPERAHQRRVAGAGRRRRAGRRDRRGHRRAVAGRRADRHRTARSRARSTTYGLPFVRAAGEIAAVWRWGRSCSRRSWCRRSPTGCSTPAATARCGSARSRRRCGRCARRCWCR